jgi:GNAT superfamily N-acetyltransferase
MPASDLAVAEVPVEDLYAIRRRVLRGDDPSKKVADDRDHDDTALHLATYLGDRMVAGGSFYSSSGPVNAELVTYQLRYLATEVDVQRSGAGGLLLRAAESRLASRGAEQLWANGRDSALDFYEKVGWSCVPGSEHLSAETQLPHTVIYKVIRRRDAVSYGWADPADAAALAGLREEMHFSIALRLFDSEWIAHATDYFADVLGAGDELVAVARTDKGEIVASAAATMRRKAPSPWLPSGRVAYVHSVSTRPGFRRRGLSQALVEQLIDEIRARGVRRVELHATDQGEPIYRDLGFTVRSHSPEMRLDLA